MGFLNCNLDTEEESYGPEYMGIPEAQTFPARYLGNRNFLGIPCPWFPVEHLWLHHSMFVRLFVPSIQAQA